MATSLDDAAAHLKAWQEKRAKDARIAGAISRPAAQADLAGQMFVREIELKQKPVALALADDPVPTFLNLPFDEAVEAFVRRYGAGENLDRILRGYARQGHRAAALMLEALSRRTYSELETLLQDGGRLRDFAAAIRSGETQLGIGPADNAYLETVFRTNVQSAYGNGRAAQLADPFVRSARPYLQFRTVGDNRVRDSHRELDGMIFKNSDETLAAVGPPLGYSCRCSLVSLDSEDLEKLGGESRVSPAPSNAKDPDFE